MKLSNIILISVLGSITVLMLTAMIEFSIKAVPHSQITQTHAIDYIEEELPAFHYLVIEDSNSLKVMYAEAFAIKRGSEGTKEKPDVTYVVQQDTLYIQHTHYKGHHWQEISVQVPEGAIRWIHSKNSGVTLQDVQTQQLAIEMEGGHLSMEGAGHIEQVSLQAQHVDHLRIQHSLTVDALAIDLKHSNVYVETGVKSLTGGMLENSVLQIRTVQSFNFSRDESSRLDYRN